MIRFRFAAAAAIATLACAPAWATNVQVGPPYQLFSTGFSQATVSSTAVGITPPGGSVVCFAVFEGNAVRYRTDGVNPTASVGVPLAVATPLQITSPLGGIKFIAQTGSATLNLDCYR